MATRTHVLLDTSRLNDALACGHRAPIDYSEGGLRVSYEAHEILGPIARINGIEGQIETTGFEELNELIRALTTIRDRVADVSVAAAEAA